MRMSERMREAEVGREYGSHGEYLFCGGDWLGLDA